MFWTLSAQFERILTPFGVQVEAATARVCGGLHGFIEAQVRLYQYREQIVENPSTVAHADALLASLAELQTKEQFGSASPARFVPKTVSASERHMATRAETGHLSQLSALAALKTGSVKINVRLV